jgi:hypothetical protein
MSDDKKLLKEVRPRSAKNPLQQVKDSKKTKYYLKESEQINKIREYNNLINSPMHNDIISFEKTIISKEKYLNSEIKKNRTKNHLQKIERPPKTQTNIYKLPKIDVDRGKNKKNKDSKDDSEHYKSITRNKIEINCEKNNTNNFNNNDSNFIEKNKEKEKLIKLGLYNHLGTKKYSFSKNNKSIDKLNISINQKEKKELIIPIIDNKNINQKCIKGEENDIIYNLKKNTNLSLKVDIKVMKEKIEKKESLKEIEQINNKEDLKEAEKKNVKEENEIKKENNLIKKNKVKFDKEVSIININEKIDNIENDDNNNLTENNITTNRTQNTAKADNSKSNIDIINNPNIILNEDKYNSYNITQTVKNSANSNKNLSVISEQINASELSDNNTHLSGSKIEPFQGSNNKANNESSDDKNCIFFQSLSNSVGTDPYLNKTIICKDRKIYLGEVIYDGSRCVIYKGLDTNIGELICVKRYRDKNNSEEYQKEIDVYNLINLHENENIVKFYGFKNDEESNFIFLEHASGDSLKKIIKLYGGSLNEKIIRNYTRQILNALSFLHTNIKVAHRDLKCDNIILDKNGIIKLIDFGCAGIMDNPEKKINEQNNENNNEEENKNIDPNKPFYEFKGSWPWCAPEILLRQFYGTKCDIWSLGCAIIEMGGMEPWNNTINGYYQYITIVGKSENKPEIPKQFSYELKDFLSYCLEKDPDKRADADKLLNHFFITGTKIDNKTVFIT